MSSGTSPGGLWASRVLHTATDTLYYSSAPDPGAVERNGHGAGRTPLFRFSLSPCAGCPSTRVSHVGQRRMTSGPSEAVKAISGQSFKGGRFPQTVSCPVWQTNVAHRGQEDPPGQKHAAPTFHCPVWHKTEKRTTGDFVSKERIHAQCCRRTWFSDVMKAPRCNAWPCEVSPGHLLTTSTKRSSSRFGPFGRSLRGGYCVPSGVA